MFVQLVIACSVVGCRLLLVPPIRTRLVTLTTLCPIFRSLLLFVGVSSRMNRLATLVISALDRLMFIALISIMLKFVVLVRWTALCACCVMLFSLVCDGDGWTKVPGLWSSCLTWAPLFRTDLFDCVDEGLIVSMVICSFRLASTRLKVLTNADPFMLGAFDSLTCSVRCCGSVVSSVIVCVWRLVWASLISATVWVSV